MSTVTQINGSGTTTTTTSTDVNGNLITVNGAAIVENCNLSSLQNCDLALFPFKGDAPLLNAFVAGGWSVGSYHQAVGTITWVLGDPPDQQGVIDPRTGDVNYPDAPPAFEMQWFSEPEFGSGVWGYNSNTTSNPNVIGNWAFIPVSGVQYVELGDNSFETAEKLAIALNGVVSFDISGNYVLTFPIPDFALEKTAGNERVLNVSGFTTVGGNQQGAGYKFTSQTLNGLTIQLDVSVYTNAVQISSVNIDSSSGTAQPVNRKRVTQLATSPTWTFITDQYSFYAYTHDAGIEPFDINSGNIAYAVTMPNSAHMLAPHGFPFALPGVFLTIQDDFTSLYFEGNSEVDGGFDQRAGTSWYLDETVNGASSNRTNSGLSVGLPIRQGTPNLTAPNSDYDVILPAQVFMSSDGPLATGPMYYVGDLWNCVLVHRDPGPIFSSYVPDTTDNPTAGDLSLALDWRVLFKQDSPTQCAILIGVADENLEGSGGGGINRVKNGVKVTHTIDHNLELGSSHGSTTYTASGGTVSPGHPYTWAITGLPTDWTSDAGLVTDPITNSVIVFSGPVSTHNGQSFPLNITATDSLGASSALQYYMVLGPTLAVSANFLALPNGHVGVPYTSICVGVSGGTDGGYGPYAIEGGTLPPGLSFDAGTGIISGTPTTPGTYGGLIFSVQDTGSGAWSSPATAESIQVF